MYVNYVLSIWSASGLVSFVWFLLVVAQLLILLGFAHRDSWTTSCKYVASAFSHHLSCHEKKRTQKQKARLPELVKHRTRQPRIRGSKPGMTVPFTRLLLVPFALNFNLPFSPQHCDRRRRGAANGACLSHGEKRWSKDEGAFGDGH